MCETETMDDYFAKKNMEQNRNTWVGNHPKIDYVLQKSSPYLKPGMKVAEVGIGDGHLLKALYKKKLRCTGIDISKYLIEYHQKKMKESGYDISFIRKNIAEENQPLSEKQDLFFCLDILEHLTESDYHRAIKNIFNMLNENGLFIGSFPYDEDLEKGLVCCPSCNKTFHRVGHQHQIDFAKLRRSLSGMFDILSFGNVLKPYKTFMQVHLKDMLSNNFRKYVPGGTVFFIARKCSK